MISPGHHVYRGPDGSWRYASPGDAFVRISGSGALLQRVRDVAYGRPDPADRSAGSDGELDGILAALTDRGVLARPADPDGGGLVRRTIHVEGTNRVAETVAGLLGAGVTRGPVDEGVVAGADVVVSCADWLPDTRWQQLDSWCAAHRTAWHGCYAEGTSLVLGPLSVPGRTASYRDTRGRRLAASGTPEELLALWAHLESDDPHPVAPWSAAGAAVVAGFLAADVLALLGGQSIPSEGHQLVLDPGTATLRRHPVLPLPVLDGAPA